jgi:hypothetical protein
VRAWKGPNGADEPIKKNGLSGNSGYNVLQEGARVVRHVPGRKGEGMGQSTRMERHGLDSKDKKVNCGELRGEQEIRS